MEAVAYRDTWGRGTDSYLHMMYERLMLMRDLLSEKGSIYVHCDWRMNSLLRILMDEVFSQENFRNDIVWSYRSGGASRKESLPRKHDTILFYAKTDEFQVHSQTERQYLEKPFMGSKKDEKGRYYVDTILRDVVEGEINIVDEGFIKKYNVRPVLNLSSERLDFPTQKPVGLLDILIKQATTENGILADLFCGSGTTLEAAERFGLRWIGVDLGRYAIHTTRKRLIQVQRELHSGGKPYRSFDVYNMGRYERQWWQLERLKGADGEHRRIVLEFYKAAPLANPPNPLLHGKKAGAYVHVDQIDSIFSESELRAAAEAARPAGGRELHCLAWEFEMELVLKKQAIEAETGLTIRLKYIPREIMEPNRTECQFFEAGYLEANAVKKGNKVDVELVHFTPALAEAPEAEMAALRERAVKSPFDFIDFWAVDFEWRDGKPFEHRWQDFRTRKNRSLKTRSGLGWEYEVKGKHQICVKVIDVFGVDTTTVIEVEG